MRRNGSGARRVPAAGICPSHESLSADVQRNESASKRLIVAPGERAADHFISNRHLHECKGTEETVVVGVNTVRLIRTGVEVGLDRYLRPNTSLFGRCLRGGAIDMYVFSHANPKVAQQTCVHVLFGQSFSDLAGAGIAEAAGAE